MNLEHGKSLLHHNHHIFDFTDLVVGDDVRMDCGFDGIPSPVATWTGGRLDAEDRTGLSSDQRHFSINSVQVLSILSFFLSNSSL